MFNHKAGDGYAADPHPADGLADYEAAGSNPEHASASAVDPDSGVKRGLKNRHLSMMALAGIIGPGLLIGAGGALANGGPASLLIGFGVIGIIAFAIMQSLGEITTIFPGGGSFVSLAERFVDKSFSVAVGWNYFIIWATVLANEYNVVCSIMTYWVPQVPLWGWFLILWTIFMGFQLLGVAAFGEAEFWLALFKLLGLTAYFIFSIIYAAGGLVGQDEPLGFRYWDNPGPFNGNGFRGVATVFVFCSTFYAGVESVAVAAGETRNPGTAVPQAIRQVFWRIIFVYMGSAFFYGLTCPANAEGLVGGEARALRSPMTIAIQNAGWNGGTFSFSSTLIFPLLIPRRRPSHQRLHPRNMSLSHQLIHLHRLPNSPLHGAVRKGAQDPRLGQQPRRPRLGHPHHQRRRLHRHDERLHGCRQGLRLHRQPLRREHVPRLGVHQLHPHPLPSGLGRPGS